jgi:hypothetical protein
MIEDGKPKNKTVQVGSNYFRTPFRANGLWVEDTDRNSVAECRTPSIAKALAKILNETYG